ncbi:hypothetical protein EK904_003014 [Melospiza melodia maxima]|nr:hypothetical protein EK904_003014 [Melospiza melodia maxima]
MFVITAHIFIFFKQQKRTMCLLLMIL